MKNRMIQRTRYGFPLARGPAQYFCLLRNLSNSLLPMAGATLAVRLLARSDPYRQAGFSFRPGIRQWLFLPAAILALTFLTFTARANNIQVSNPVIVPNSDVPGTAFVQFDLQWENSWRDGINWDAAWVFVKYRVPATHGGNDLWKHAWLSTDDNDHSPGTGTAATINIGTTEISSADRGMGAFIYRSATGSGDFEIEGARLLWNFTEQGVDASKPVDIRVFSIEMVYVAEGAFAAGSGGFESGRFHAGGSSNSTPFQVTESWNGCIEDTGGCLWGASTLGHGTIGGAGNLNEDYPTGYHAFYMMKYSITQQQYVDFLNTLTRTQQQPRSSSTTVGNFMGWDSTETSPIWRNGVRLMSDPGGTAPRVFGCDLNNNNTAGENNDGQWIAMNFMSWMDGAAYMDWSGLRPMTELEYEKAARGPATPVANEYAWGTAFIASNKYTLNSAGEANEGIDANYNTTGTRGNAVYSNTSYDLGGPLRVGIFAAHGSNNSRVTSGASYWGIMELSGNLWERAVAVGHATGRAFTGLHGDGDLSVNGHANITAWPGLSGGEVTGAGGAGQRGGSWQVYSGRPWMEGRVDRLRVSDRNSAALGTGRSSVNGFRGVRTAPALGGGD